MVTRAELLGVSEGALVWVIGHSDEENALLDPISNDVQVLTERDEDNPEHVSAAIVVVDDAETLADDLDDALPQLGSVPVVWVALPNVSRDLTVASVTSALDNYGWSAAEPVRLGHGWSAVRVTPA